MMMTTTTRIHFVLCFLIKFVQAFSTEQLSVFNNSPILLVTPRKNNLDNHSGLKKQHSRSPSPALLLLVQYSVKWEEKLNIPVLDC